MMNIDKIAAAFNLKPVDVGEYRKMKVGSFRFELTCFDAEGLGRVSVMDGSAMMGMMKMVTLVINPFEKDAPLFSYDRIFAMGNDISYLELYDTMLGKSYDTSAINKVIADNASLPDIDPGEHWYDSIKMKESTYKKGKKAQKALFDAFFDNYLEEYLKACQKAENCDREAKKEKAAAYTEGLLEHGGPACDRFIEKKGIEYTQKLFREYMFGTK